MTLRFFWIYEDLSCRTDGYLNGLAPQKLDVALELNIHNSIDFAPELLQY